MNTPAIVLAVALAIATAARAQTMNEREFEYRGTTYVTRVPNNVPSSPSWVPGLGEPPLSIAKALELADAEFQKVFQSFDAFTLQNIALTRQGTGWMYLVTYLQKPSDVKESTPLPGPGKGSIRTQLPLIYYITLDGKVHAPAPK